MAAAAVLPAAARAGEVALYAGIGNVGKSPERLEAGIELRAASGWRQLLWVGGLAGNEDSAFWGYLGAAWRWKLGARGSLTPGFAVSLYEDGDGKDLGGPVEFRTSLELAFQSSPGTRLGIATYHLSNAGLYDLNPGSNSIIATLTLTRP